MVREMTAQPSSPVDRSAEPDRVVLDGAEDGPARRGARGLRERLGRPPRGILLLGLAGALLMALGAYGAGGVLVRDPVLTNSPLGFWRYGHGREIATALVYLGVGLLAWAWVRLGREVIARRVGGRAVLTTAFAWLAPVLLCPPLFTRDPFSYLAQGALPLNGFDPYAVGPEAMPGVFTDNVHYFWQDTPAPYGPLFILYAKSIAWLAGDNVVLGVVLMRLALMVGLVPLLWALPELSRRMGGRPALALWIAVANPMMIVHMVGGGHNDLLVMGLLAAAALVALRGHHAGGIALATLAMAVKASAGLALPFLVLVWAARLPGSPTARILRAGASGVAVFAAVFTACTLAAGVGLGWLPALSAPSMIVNWLSPPTGIGQFVHTLVNLVWPVPMQPFVNAGRAVGAAILLVIIVRQWWAARDGGPDALRRAGIVLLVAALLSPTTLPWYLSWGIALLAMVDWTERGLQLMVFVSLFLLVVYYPDGEAALYDLLVLGVGIALAALAAVSLVRPDPLGLRRAAPVEPARAAR
jgi:alpha-1,6-mannosyltransferase